MLAEGAVGGASLRGPWALASGWVPTSGYGDVFPGTFLRAQVG